LYYSFDTSTIYGSTVTNLGSGGSAYNAEMVNGATINTTVMAKVVGSAALNLSSELSQFIRIPPLQTGNEGVSFAFWFRFSGGSFGGSLFDFGNGNQVYGLLFGLKYSGDIDASVLDGGANTLGSRTSLFGENVNDGVWRHAALTIDNSGNWVVYLNGTETNSFTSLCYPPFVTRSYNYLGKSNGGNSYMSGGIDEFYMFQSVLSASQVLSLYTQGGKSRKDYRPTSIIFVLMVFSIACSSSRSYPSFYRYVREVGFTCRCHMF